MEICMGKADVREMFNTKKMTQKPINKSKQLVSAVNLLFLFVFVVLQMYGILLTLCKYFKCHARISSIITMTVTYKIQENKFKNVS